ncbi:hypothetical protein PS645_05362 [Pseudomonas fluorescens]|uniref:Uncharacterized protein n=1 Tax=Pseudomonas fluorescens TaxID=294 RepID=A0A5E6XHW0_PSEFL|nr:hypothetical protein PS645_05362 [Pseudomonas fluorescens]
MGNGFGVVGIHVLDHADFGLAGERVCQCQLIDPVNSAKAADVAMTHGLEYPEIEIMGLVIILRLGEIAVVAIGSSVDGAIVFKFLRLC